jgi:hypothetical protein
LSFDRRERLDDDEARQMLSRIVPPSRLTPLRTYIA